jgi:hypothetical protein
MSAFGGGRTSGSTGLMLQVRTGWKAGVQPVTLVTMLNWPRRALIGAFALAVTSPAAGERRTDEVIVVRLRHSYAICAGFCPNFEMKVTPDGSVV